MELLNVVGYSSNVDWLDEKYLDLESVRAMIQALSARDVTKLFLRAIERGIALPEVLICGADIVLIKNRAALHNLILQLVEVEERLIKIEGRLEGTKARECPLAKKEGEYILNKTIMRKEDRLGRARKEAENEDCVHAL